MEDSKNPLVEQMPNRTTNPQEAGRSTNDLGAIVEGVKTGEARAQKVKEGLEAQHRGEALDKKDTEEPSNSKSKSKTRKR